MLLWSRQISSDFSGAAMVLYQTDGSLKHMQSSPGFCELVRSDEQSAAAADCKVLPTAGGAPVKLLQYVGSIS